MAGEPFNETHPYECELAETEGMDATALALRLASHASDHAYAHWGISGDAADRRAEVTWERMGACMERMGWKLVRA